MQPLYGGADVFTNTRAGYVDECSNIGQLLKNLKFSLAMENEIMGAILNDEKEPDVAAKEWIKANPEALDAWLKDVKTQDGKGAAMEAAKAALTAS